MEPSYSDYQGTSSGGTFLTRKLLIIGGIILLLVIVIIMVLFFSRAGTQQSQNPADVPVVIPSVTIAPLQNDPVIINEVKSTTEAFVVSMQTNDVRSAALSNIDSALEDEQKENLVAFFEKERTLFSNDGSYDPSIAANGIQVVGEQAQVLLEETLNGQLITIRRDLVKTEKGWKIRDTLYNKPLDLKEQQEALILEETLTSAAEYRHTPQSYPLPNGDTLEIFRTYWSDKENPYTNPGQYATTAFSEVIKYDFLQYKDFLYYIPEAQQDYTIVLFDAPYVRMIEHMPKGENRGSYGKYYSFDIRLIEGDTRKAVLLVYDGIITPGMENPGTPPGWILSIPVAVE